MSALIRYASFEAVLPYVVLVLFYRVGNRFCNEGKNHIKKICMETLVFVIFLMGIMVYSRIDKGFKAEMFPSEQNSFEYYRGLYTDYPHIPYEGNEEFYESIEWDQEFYNVVRDWMFIDPRFNTENLKKNAEKSADVGSEINLAGESYALKDDFVKQTQNNTIRIYMSFAVIALLILSMGFTIYKLWKKESRFDWVFLAIVQMTAVAEWIYLLYEKGRFIDRAFYCATFPALYIGIWIIARQLRFGNHYKLIYLVLGYWPYIFLVFLRIRI